jgi:hypothetical protein
MLNEGIFAGMRGAVIGVPERCPAHSLGALKSRDRPAASNVETGDTSYCL